MNHPKKLSLLHVCVLALLLVSHASLAESLSYSGRLVNANGSPVSGTPDLLFELAYTGSTGTIRCSDTVDDVPLTNGVFHTKIDFDCTAAGTSFDNVLAQVPAGQSVAIRVTNTTASKVYSFQELHSIPKAKLSETAMQLIPMGANTNEVLTWTGSKWEPKPIAPATGGTVTSVATGSGLSGGTITTSGTIAIANGGVTDTHLAGSISRSKLVNGTASSVVVNNGAGVMSDVSQLPVSMGGTGSSTAAGALTNLGIGTAGTLNYGAGWDQVIAASLPSCIGTQKLTVTPPPTVTLACTADETGWTVSGSDIYSANSGNVGIGVASPQAKLDVNGTIRATNLCDETGSNCKDISSGWGSLDGTGLGSWQARNFDTNYQATTDGLVVAFAYNAYIRGISDTNSNPTTVRIESEGNTTNAARATITFPVKKNEYWRIQTITYAGGSIYWIPLAGADAALWTQTGAHIGYMAGRVGVGISSPTEELDVVGDIQLTGGLRLKSNNGNLVELKARAGSAALSFGLPIDAGTSGQALVTDGAGNLSWATVSAGATTVGGDLSGTVSNAQIAAGTIVNADIANTTITYGKLNLTDGDIPLAKVSTIATITPNNATIANGDSLLTAVNKAQGQINALKTADNGFLVKNGTDSITGTVTVSSGSLLISNTPSGAVLTEAANVQYVQNYVNTFGQWSKNGSNLYYSSGNVGIGTSAPAGKLSIEGSGAVGMQIKTAAAGAIDTVNFVNDMDATGYFWLSKGTSASAAPAAADRLMGITNEGNVEIYGQQTNGSTDASGVLALKTQASSVGGTRNEVSLEFYADRTNINTVSGFLGYESNTAFDLSLMNSKTGKLLFGTSGTTAMTIDSTGNVEVPGTIKISNICDETGANCKDVSNGWGTASPANVFGNWPDFILCDDGISRSVLRFDTFENSTNLAWYSKASGGGGHSLRFVSTTGAFYDNTAFTGYAVCTGKSLATLIAEGRTFGALGGGVDWTASGGNVYRTGGNVGIGTSTPAAKLEVSGGIRPAGVTPGTACSPMGAQAYYSANGAPVYCNGTIWANVGTPTYVESSGQTVVTGASTYSFNHGLAVVPKKFGVYAVVTVAVCGFLVGDRVAMATNDGDAARQTTVYANATKVGYIKKTESVFRCPDQSSDISPSSANFNFVLWAEN